MMYSSAQLGWATRKLGLFCLGLALMFSPLTTSAMTQGEFLGWLKHITEGNSAGGAAEAVQWARENGLNPKGGWNPGKQMTQDVLAQTLVQLWKLNSKEYGSDYIWQLRREGVELPEGGEIDRTSLVLLLDNFGFSGKVYSQSRRRGSGVNGDNGHPGNIPPPGFRNPSNPHYNDGDPLPPGSANGKGGNNRDKRR